MYSNIYFYHRNKQRLQKNFAGRYLLIKDEQVIGDYNTWTDACRRGLEMFNHDNFFVKYCGC